MIRKFAIVPNLLAMMMVLFAMFVPHHHHQTMICLVHQICVLDGCCDDEHTSHSGAHQEEDECKCISQEKFCPSDQSLPDVTPLPSVLLRVPGPVFAGSIIPRSYPLDESILHAPPLLTWRINC